MAGKTPDTGFDTTLTSRYECKYLIDEFTAAALRRYLASHAKLDPYSAASADHRYRVLSLYLDTPGLRLYRDTAQGVRNRYKLRLRYYAEEGDGPVFFEVKKRADVIVRKSRELMSREQAQDFLLHGSCHRNARNGDDLDQFLDRCREMGAVPALRLRYWREAWESRASDPVRITFDTTVEHCMLSAPGLVETRPAWRRTGFGAPVILEVKFTDLRPRWLDQMLQHFNLDKVSVAKYAESIEEILRAGRLSVLEARMGLGLHGLDGGATAVPRGRAS